MSALHINFMSHILCGPTNVSILVPNPDLFDGNPKEFYSAQKKYKVLWLLHGGDCDCDSWITYTNLTRYVRGREVIVVMPTGLNTDFSNHIQFADGFMVQDFFFDELMPFVYGWLPASDRKEDNFIAGYSMGAAAVWMYSLFRKDCFGKAFPIGSAPKDYRYMEPYRELTAAEFRKQALENPKAFPAGYGNPHGGIHLKEVNMISKYDTVGAFLDSWEHTYDRVAEAARTENMPEIYVHCDEGERTFGKVKEFEKQVQEWNLQNIYFEYTKSRLTEYDFCDCILPRLLEICGV